MRKLDEQSFKLLQCSSVYSDDAERSAERARLDGGPLSIIYSNLRAIALLTLSRWYVWRASRLARRSIRLLVV